MREESERQNVTRAISAAHTRRESHLLFLFTPLVESSISSGPCASALRRSVSDPLNDGHGVRARGFLTQEAWETPLLTAGLPETCNHLPQRETESETPKEGSARQSGFHKTITDRRDRLIASVVLQTGVSERVHSADDDLIYRWKRIQKVSNQCTDKTGSQVTGAHQRHTLLSCPLFPSTAKY